MRFIKLTTFNGRDLFVNVETITAISRNETGRDSKADIYTTNSGFSFSVKETPEQIFAKIASVTKM